MQKVDCFVEKSCPNFVEIRRKSEFAMTWGFVTCGPNEALVVSGNKTRQVKTRFNGVRMKRRKSGIVVSI